MVSIDQNSVTFRLRNGDTQALEEIYWEYCEDLHGLALHYLRDEQLAEDAVQDVFLNIWNNRRDLDTELSLSGFLFTSLKNHVLNMMKIHKRRILRQYEYTGINKPNDQNPDDALIISDYKSALNRGLQKLPPTKRHVYELKIFGGFKNDEIANHLGISVNTVKSHYSLAKKSIKHFILTRDNLP